MLEKLSDKNKHRGLKYRKKSGRRQKVFPAKPAEVSTIHIIPNFVASWLRKVKKIKNQEVKPNYGVFRTIYWEKKWQ